MNYKHTQTGWMVLSSFIGIILIFAVLPLPEEHRKILLPVMATIFFISAALMGTLTVEVKESEVQIRFGIGLIRKNFPLDEIKSCEPVRNRWWYGWGVRLIPGGWLYNVSGLDAVELVMRNGKIFRIGTDEPRLLADVIQAHMAKLR